MEDSVHPAIRGLKTVCRCNNVKYRTIEKAIREGARTLCEIALKTTATTGYCGGTCTPEVQEMLDELAPKKVECEAASEAGWWVRPKKAGEKR